MEKEAEIYLLNLFKKIGLYKLSEKENREILKDKVSFILKKLQRKKFKRKITEKTKETLKRKILNAINENKPIYFVIPFGGYKHFWNSSYPDLDWAELFNMRFMTEYVLPILSVHQPGVIIEYMSEDLIINRMNNYPKESLEQYSKSFISLINWYKQYIPKNLQIKYFRVGNRCNKDKIIDEVEKLISKKTTEFNRLSNKEKENELHRSRRSVMLDGEKDLVQLSEEDKESRIIESRLIELAYYDVEAKPEFMGDYLWSDDHICVCFSFGLSSDNVFEDLTLASSHGSIVDFWIGKGILEYRNGRFIPKIVSKNQYIELESKIKKLKIGSFPFKNFGSIDLIIN
ncbi:hypothetical protein KJ684_02030 [Patescibacteria group bacterium]|nr:hypothetical protein [Patescibacteria group bacterium]